MGRGTLFWIWAALSVLWVSAVAYYASGNWPAMPLDLGNDEGTRAAFDRAVAWHAGVCALIAVLPPLVLLLIGRAMSRS